MRAKVLLVDDDEMLLAGLKRQLRNRFKIETAISGEDAVKMVEENGPYAVVVSDYIMPGMNGIEFLRQVKVSDPHTIRMMLTGSADITLSHLGHSELPTSIAMGPPRVLPCRTPPSTRTASASNFIRAPRPTPRRRRAKSRPMSSLVTATCAGMPSTIAVRACP